MIARPRVLFYCHHSVGMGHLVRTIALIKALVSDFDVTLLSGGRFPDSIVLPDGISFVQLPVVKYNSAKSLVAADDDRDVQTVMKERAHIVKQTFISVLPDFIITELFPFGRLEFLGDLLPTLRIANRQNKKVFVLSSNRDLLEPSTVSMSVFPGFVKSVCNTYYSGVLVHSDPVICRMEDTFEQAGIIEPPIYYTGFVCKEKAKGNGTEGRTGVIASFGGGAVGFPMARLIVAAYVEHGFGDGVPLKVVAGPLFPAEQYKELLLMAEGVERLTVVRHVENLLEELSSTAASISQCGYNTTMEILQTGVPALVIPYENETNSEQVVRAKKFAELSLLRYVRFDGLTASVLAEEVRETLAFKPHTSAIDLNGAENTRDILMNMHEGGHKS